jgi:hypothetical protein
MTSAGGHRYKEVVLYLIALEATSQTLPHAC